MRCMVQVKQSTQVITTRRELRLKRLESDRLKNMPAAIWQLIVRGNICIGFSIGSIGSIGKLVWLQVVGGCWELLCNQLIKPHSCRPVHQSMTPGAHLSSSESKLVVT